MAQTTLRFRTNSKLEKLIGRELITNNTIAIFELIKNSYDAGAKKVHLIFKDFKEFSTIERDGRFIYTINDSVVSADTVVSTELSSITIIDNGKGMTFEEVKKYWMEIGTVHKELIRKINIENDSINRMYTRILNGEKGIGRFGTDKLGAILNLTSIDSSGMEKTCIKINWDDFNDHTKLIQDVEIDCSTEELVVKKKSGLKLEILKLREEWTIKDIEDLKRQLKKFVSPFSQEEDLFSIYISVNSVKEKIINDAFEFTSTFIEASLDYDGLFEYIIVDGLNEIRKSIKNNRPNFGPVKLKIIYMDRAAKVAFTKRAGIPSREYGNIKVFRDNFRILPYGEPSNDWLGIDNMHAQAVFRSLGTRDIIGYVQITNLGNIGLKDSTSRQGLVEDNQEFRNFKEFVWNCIILLQDYVFSRIKEESEKQGKVIEQKVSDVNNNTVKFRFQLEEAIKNTKIPNNDKENLYSIIKNNVQNLQKDLQIVQNANKELSKKIKIFERITGSEGILFDILHVIKHKVAIIETQMFRIKRQCERANIHINNEIVDQSLSAIGKLVFSALQKASAPRLVKKTYILREIIQESIEENKLYVGDSGINIDFIPNDGYKRVFCNVESIKIVFDNLFSNSFKVLKSCINKKIIITTSINDKFIEIMFTDTGPGVKDDEAPFIFNVGYSKTKGSGLGLPTSLDIIQDHGGNMSLVKLNDEMEGARFLIKLPIYKGA